MNDRTIRQISVSIALVFFVGFQSFHAQIPQSIAWLLPGAVPSDESWSNYTRFLSATFGGLKLGALILIIERLMFRIVARRFVGKWAYESTAGNFAILKINVAGLWVGGCRLTYDVYIYRDADQAICALKREPVEPHTVAQGIQTQLNDNELSVIYKVDNTGESDWNWKAVRGVLSLKPTDNPNILIGIWESTRVNDDPDVEDKDIRTGKYTAYRPKEFMARYGGKSAK